MKTSPFRDVFSFLCGPHADFHVPKGTDQQPLVGKAGGKGILIDPGIDDIPYHIHIFPDIRNDDGEVQDMLSIRVILCQDSIEMGQDFLCLERSICSRRISYDAGCINDSTVNDSF